MLSPTPKQPLYKKPGARLPPQPFKEPSQVEAPPPKWTGPSSFEELLRSPDYLAFLGVVFIPSCRGCSRNLVSCFAMAWCTPEHVIDWATLFLFG